MRRDTPKSPGEKDFVRTYARKTYFYKVILLSGTEKVPQRTFEIELSGELSGAICHVPSTLEKK